MSFRKEKILDMLRDNSFIDALVGFSERQNPLRDFLQKRAEDLQSPRYVISVVGVQGAGKSSFINALLMDTAILPRDVAETTCVPTEVTYSTSPTATAAIYFKDGSSTKISASEKDLKQFLHNDHNPGNKLGVSKVVVESNSPLLKSGIVVVDLPGMGSLTEANMKTTINYIKTSSAGIYLLRTVPPLTRLEQSQISAIWPNLSKMWFVQNRWNDESLQEAQDGQSHNQLILSDIQMKNPLIPEQDIDVYLVDVYKALDLGVLSSNEGNIKDSGLLDFSDIFSQTSSAWATELLNNTRRELIQFIHLAQSRAHDENTRLAMDTDVILKELKLKEEEFKLNLDQAKEGIASAKRKAEQFREDINDLSQNLLDDYKKRMRNAMREMIHAGVVDGTSLDSAYKDNNGEIMADFQEKLSEKINTFVAGFAHFLDENMHENNQYLEKNGPGLKDRIKIEKAGSLMGGIGGFAAGSVWLVPLLGSNPAGWAVLGVLCVASLVGSLIGWATDKGVGAMRKNAAEKEVFALIDEHAKSLKQKVRGDIRNFVSSLDENFDCWLSQKQEDFLAEKRQILKEAKMAEAEKHDRSKQINVADRLFTHVLAKLEECK